ncbi:MAG: hypothetical protein HIU86_07720 [Acidobacteria bacterium]|nr:hypothetical protein [Acidobacteriota bacterium]
MDDEPDHGPRDQAVRAAWWSVLEPELPEAPATAADHACGTGSLSLLLTDRRSDVTGVDLAPAVAVVGRWSRLLAPRGRPLLIEGLPHTEAGLHGADVERIVRASRDDALAVRLDDRPELRGGPAPDERFLVASRR